jgi:oxygen-independent coproporphyrinogen-3 oxidase
MQNAPDLGGYNRAIDAGKFAIVKGLALNDDDRLRASIIERLMCDLALDLDAFGGLSRFAGEIAKLQPLVEQGLLTIEGARMTVTEPGRPYVRIAAAAFDAYLAAGQKRHSVAV